MRKRPGLARFLQYTKKLGWGSHLFIIQEWRDNQWLRWAEEELSKLNIEKWIFQPLYKTGISQKSVSKYKGVSLRSQLSDDLRLDDSASPRRVHHIHLLQLKADSFRSVPSLVHLYRRTLTSNLISFFLSTETEIETHPIEKKEKKAFDEFRWFRFWRKFLTKMNLWPLASFGLRCHIHVEESRVVKLRMGVRFQV